MIPVAVVGHWTRQERAEKLAEDVKAEFCTIDDGTAGPGKNHDVAWEWLGGSGHKWSVVLEDDAIPVCGFQEQLQKVLAVAPTQIVSLYLGRGRPPHWQSAIARVAASESHFLVGSTLLHHVGVAMRTNLVGSMLNTRARDIPVDESIGQWAMKQGMHVAYSWPSIVDHDDRIPTTITKRSSSYAGETGERNEVRKAWKYGKRLNWENSATWIKTPGT